MNWLSPTRTATYCVVADFALKYVFEITPISNSGTSRVLTLFSCLRLPLRTQSELTACEDYGTSKNCSVSEFSRCLHMVVNTEWPEFVVFAQTAL